MNMKKSIAGVMAGAMAVSAMATVVSADQDAISLTYDLKTYVQDKNATKAKVTVVANYEGTAVSSASWEADGIDRYGKDDDDSTGFISFGADNGFVLGGKIYTKNGVEVGVGTVSTVKDFEFSARPYKNLTTDDETRKTYNYKATSSASNVDGAIYDKALDNGNYFDNNEKAKPTYKNESATEYRMAISKGADTKYKFDMSDFNMLKLGYTTDEAAQSVGYNKAFTTDIYAFSEAVAKVTYEIPNTIQLNKANGWGWDYSYNKGNFTEAEMEHIFQDYFYTTLYGDVTMSAETFTKGFFDSNGDKKGMVYSATSLVNQPVSVAVGAFTAGQADEKVFPFKTTLKPSLVTDAAVNRSSYVVNTGNNENDVVAALQARKAGGNHYTRPIAVLNDAIANHDNVVFTFTSYNGYVATTKSKIANQWVDVDRGYSYETSSHDWHNPTFGQHLYTNVTDKYSLFDSTEYDMYGSYSSAWGINLFTGAVVVNSGITMQLSDTDTFNWGNNTLSFDWFDIIDEGKITDAKTFLTSMLLYTPVDWYWDSLTVVVSDDEEEAIDAGEGLDGEGDVIDDEEPEIVEDEPEVEVEPEVVETEAAPVETAPSPATGNAPVALAVIPVALAAAAVVAKKRG